MLSDKLCQTAAAAFGTPVYLFDLDRLKQQVELVRTQLPQARLCFAVKANPFLIPALSQWLDRFELCSPGEWSLTQKLKLPQDHLVISGVYKSAADLAAIFDQSGDSLPEISLESAEQLALLNQQAQRQQRPVSVLLRLSSGNQFGMDEAALRAILARRQAYPYLKLTGLQFYSGTQKHSAKITAEVAGLEKLCRSLEQDFNLPPLALEYGPGLAVRYFIDSGQSAATADLDGSDLAQLQVLSQALTQAGCQRPLTLEMGRFLTAACGSYLTQIVDLKTTRSDHYCLTDGGIHHLAYYGQMLGMKQPPVRLIKAGPGLKPGNLTGRAASPKAASAAAANWTVCGALCTVNDVLLRCISLPDPQPGDWLCFDRCGAYSVTEGLALFLSRALPAVAACSKADGLQCLRPSTASWPLNQPQIQPNN
ncbi:MAG: alanine racemase [Oscillospiraceae bacterium]|nr:alanine racemase [Oscillospiraceae bacterium]